MLGGTYSYATGINDLGLVVGESDITGNTGTHAFARKPVGPMVDLGTFGGTYSHAEESTTRARCDWLQLYRHQRGLSRGALERPLEGSRRQLWAQLGDFCAARGCLDPDTFLES